MRILVFLAILVTVLFWANGFAPRAGSVDPVYIPGEKLKYRVHYGFITAGEAVMSLTDKYYFVNKRVCYRAEISGNSSGAFDRIVRIRNIWGSYFDTANFLPQKSFRSIAENRYRKREEIYFDYQSHRASLKVEEKEPEEIPFTPGIQDMVSGYYYLRLLDFDGFAKGDTIKMKGIFENKTYDFNILYLGKSTVKTKFGKAGAYLISPVMPDNSLFKGRHPIKMWISDDRNRIPLKIEAELLLGSVDLDITEYASLKHPLVFH